MRNDSFESRFRMRVTAEGDFLFENRGLPQGNFHAEFFLDARKSAAQVGGQNVSLVSDGFELYVGIPGGSQVIRRL